MRLLRTSKAVFPLNARIGRSWPEKIGGVRIIQCIACPTNVNTVFKIDDNDILNDFDTTDHN